MNKLITFLEEFNATPQLQSALTGRSGENRARNRVKHIKADNDLEAVQKWLLEYRNSPSTFRAYQTEAERLLLWCLVKQHKPLSSLTRDDFRDYEDFLPDPKPTEQWVNPKKPRRYKKDGKPNPDWRPFASGLSHDNVERALRIIDSLLSYLVDGGYLDGNPLALRRLPANKQGIKDKKDEKKDEEKKKKEKKKESSAKRTSRTLDATEWGSVLCALDSMSRDTLNEINNYERTRFILMMFYHLGARISELATHTMETIEETPDGWVWNVVGKGDKPTWVPVNATLLDSIVRYRRHLGKSAFPEPGDDTPFFLSIDGKKNISGRQAFNVIKKLFSKAADLIEEDYPHKAAKLRRASPHWLRHSMLSHLAEELNDKPWILKRLARHGRFDTTLLYINTEDRKLHTAMESIEKNTNTT